MKRLALGSALVAVALVSGAAIYLWRLNQTTPRGIPSRYQPLATRPGAIDGTDYMLQDPSASPLMRALRIGDSTRVQELIAAGADVNAPDRYGVTPLMVAVADAKAAVPKLLAAGAEVNATDHEEGQSALFLAASMGDFKTSKLLVLDGAKINLRSKHGLTPLHEAALSCSPQLVRFLIMRGADANSRNAGGVTPLMVASTGCCPEVTGLLIRAGARVNARNQSGQTAISLAGSNKCAEVSSILKRARATGN